MLRYYSLYPFSYHNNFIAPAPSTGLFGSTAAPKPASGGLFGATPAAAARKYEFVQSCAYLHLSIFLTSYSTSNFLRFVLQLLVVYLERQQPLNQQFLEDYSDLHRPQHVRQVCDMLRLSIVLLTAYFVLFFSFLAAGGFFGSNPAPAPGMNYMVMYAIVLSIIVLLTCCLFFVLFF